MSRSLRVALRTAAFFGIVLAWGTLGLGSSAIAAEVENKENSSTKGEGQKAAGQGTSAASASAQEGSDGHDSSTASSPSKSGDGGTGKNMLVFADGGVRYDLGNFSRDERVGRNEDSQNDDIRSWGLPIHVGLMSRLDDNWRMGAVFGYGFNYDIDNDGDLLGQLLTLDLRLEWTAPLSDSWWVIGGPKMGLSTIIPGGILRERIDENQRVGYSTVSGPRLGFLVGVDAGVRYRVNDWFSFRGTIGYLYTMHFLLNSTASSEAVTAKQVWRAAASRVSGVLGVEAAF